MHHWLRPRPAKTDHFLVGVNNPLTDTHLLPPGTYRLTVRIAAANFDPIDKELELNHTGFWTDDDTTMRRDHLVVTLRHPD